MGLRDTLSNLSPNEFLAKMQDMFQMYQESQDDYYEEGSLQKAYKNNDKAEYKGMPSPVTGKSEQFFVGSMEATEAEYRKGCTAITRLLKKAAGAEARQNKDMYMNKLKRVQTKNTKLSLFDIISATIDFGTNGIKGRADAELEII